MSNLGKRIVYIDEIKGIAMLLVVLGHVTSTPMVIRGAIYSFHMPLFFIVSGIFFRPSNNIKKDIRSLIVPYIVVGGAIMMYKVAYSYYFNCEFEWKQILSFLLVEYKFKEIDLCGGAIWFLVVLFFSKFYLRTLIKMRCSIFFLIAGSLVSIVFSKYTHVVLPFGISQTLVCSMFVFVGYKLKEIGLLNKISQNVE